MSIEERLENLEREQLRTRRRNRLLYTVIALAACVFVGLGSASGARPKVQDTAKLIRAERFELVDADGKMRALLCMTENGPMLSLADEKGKGGVALIVDKDAPGLVLGDEKGEPSAVLSITKSGVGLTLFDEKGKPRASLGVIKDGPRLDLSDENGKKLWGGPK